MTLTRAQATVLRRLAEGDGLCRKATGRHSPDGFRLWSWRWSWIEGGTHKRGPQKGPVLNLFHRRMIRLNPPWPKRRSDIQEATITPAGREALAALEKEKS